MNERLAFYKFIIDSLPIAVVVIDSEFRIAEFNSWAEKLTGYAWQEAKGHHCGEILRSGMCDDNCPLKAILNRAESTVGVRTSILSKKEEVIHVQISAAALFDEEGKLLGGVETLLDISQLVALERERGNFISMLAHDMRSSLTGIHGLGLRLLRKPVGMDEEKERQYLEIITREAAKLEALIDDFLEFSRMEIGTLKLNLSATSLDKELEEVFENYEPRAAQNRISLELQVEDVLPIIDADANRLRRVFDNLLDNALKFSSANGTVTITAQEREQEVMVAIADDGIGIDPEDLPYIFDTFHRGRTAAGREGHGLGLATVKSIVEGHGGRIIVSSQPNVGSTFTLFLPKKRS